MYHGFLKRGGRNKEVAIKVFREQEYDTSSLPTFESEVKILCQLRHKNVIKLMGVCIEEKQFSIALEYCRYGSLSDLLKDRNWELSWRMLLKFASDTSHGIHFLHTRSPKIIHRDIKASNICIDEDFTAKISDFGLSKLKENSFAITPKKQGKKKHARTFSYIKDNCCPSGTRGSKSTNLNTEIIYFNPALFFQVWIAPEILRSQPYNETADAYSFGILLLELLRQDVVNGDFTLLKIEYPSSGGFELKRPQIPEWSPPLYSHLITNLTSPFPEDRPTFDTISSFLHVLYTGQVAGMPRLDEMVPIIL